jgi:hypothetical protein
MRDPGELRAMAIHRYSGNWMSDTRGVLPEEMECYEIAWKAEASRRMCLLEVARKRGLKSN